MSRTQILPHIIIHTPDTSPHLLLDYQSKSALSNCFTPSEPLQTLFYHYPLITPYRRAQYNSQLLICLEDHKVIWRISPFQIPPILNDFKILTLFFTFTCTIFIIQNIINYTPRPQGVGRDGGELSGPGGERAASIRHVRNPLQRYLGRRILQSIRRIQVWATCLPALQNTFTSTLSLQPELQNAHFNAHTSTATLTSTL